MSAPIFAEHDAMATTPIPRTSRPKPSYSLARSKPRSGRQKASAKKPGPKNAFGLKASSLAFDEPSAHLEWR
ncbi:MAG: hypothetical protein WA813_25405, partial [Beijerinckiaceae bacterium]